MTFSSGSTIATIVFESASISNEAQVISDVNDLISAQTLPELANSTLVSAGGLERKFRSYICVFLFDFFNLNVQFSNLLTDAGEYFFIPTSIDQKTRHVSLSQL